MRDRRSTRSVYSRNVEQNSNDETDESKHSENSNSKNEISSPMKILDQQDSKKEVLYKSFEAKDDIAQIENIPDNTQVLSPKVTEDVKDVELDIKKEKRGYRKKATKDGLTDREWLASRENRDKWSALDAKRGMCNDCKKLFSSRQVCVITIKVILILLIEISRKYLNKLNSVIIFYDRLLGIIVRHQETVFEWENSVEKIMTTSTLAKSLRA